MGDKKPESDIYSARGIQEPTRIIVCYICIIITWGLIYRSLPVGSFYAPYLFREASVLDNKYGVESLIASDLLQRSNRADAGNGKWNFDLGKPFLISELYPDPFNTTAVLQLNYATEEVTSGLLGIKDIRSGYSDGLTALTENHTHSFKILEFTVSRAPRRFGVGGSSVFCHDIISRRSILNTNTTPDLQNRIGVLNRWCGPNAFELRNITEFRFQRLLDGLGGEPSVVPGYSLRMFYYSATTILTVGFGDIVPMTSEARVFTTLEPIIGWILAGLFINALANKIVRSSKI